VALTDDGDHHRIDVLVGGVGQLYQGDLDVGRRVVDLLGDLGPGAAAEELHYGAVAVAQRLEDLAVHTLVVVGAEARGRPPGTVERRRVVPEALTPADVHGAVSDAVQGYVSIRILLDVANGLGVLPPRVVTVEVEPVLTDPVDGLSPQADAAMGTLVDLVRAEVRRAQVLDLAAQLRGLLNDGHLEPGPAVEALRALLAELDTLDREGRWGRTFAERDRLRLVIAAGESSEGMTHLDWGLWWTLIEELDRLQPLEATAAVPGATAP
jgi:hypothetical protein